MQTAPQRSSDAPTQRASQQVIFRATASALSGFLFGCAAVVISGAEQTIQSLWHLSDCEAVTP